MPPKNLAGERLPGGFLKPGQDVPDGVYEESYLERMRLQGHVVFAGEAGAEPQVDGIGEDNVGDQLSRHGHQNDGQLERIRQDQARRDERLQEQLDAHERAQRQTGLIPKRAASIWSMDPDGLAGLELAALKVLIAERDNQGEFEDLDAISTPEEAIAILSRDYDAQADKPLVEVAQVRRRRG